MADAPTQQRYTQHYLDENATLHSEQDIPGIRRVTVTRFFPLSMPVFEQQAVLAEMDLYTAAKNDKPQRWVDEPGVNGRANDGKPYTLPGRWRLVSNRLAKPGQEKPGVYQELAEGYMQPPAADEDPVKVWAWLDREARITKVTDYTASGKLAIKPFFIVTYPNVAQETVQAFKDALIPRGVLTNPAFALQTPLAGTYLFTAVKNEEQDDGSSIVSAVLADATDPTGLPVTIANNIGSLVTRTIYMGVVVPPTVPSGIIGVDYTVRDFSFDPSIGMYALQIEMVSEKTLTTGINSEDETDIEKIEAQDFTGLRAGDTDQTGATVTALWTPGNPSPGVEQTQQVRIKTNGTKDKAQKKRTVKDVPNFKVRKTKTAFKTVAVVTEKAAAATLGDPPTAAAGVVVTNDSTKNGLQQFDNDQTTETEIPVPAIPGGQPATLSNRMTAFETQTEKLERSQPLATDLTPSAAGGTIVEKSGEITDGNLSNVKTNTVVETPVTAAVVEKQATIFQTVSRRTDKAQTLTLPLSSDTSLVATAAAGVITNKTGQETAGKLGDVVTEVITEIAVPALIGTNPAAVVVKRLTAFDLTTDTLNKNQAAAAADPTVPGQTVENSLTPGGSVDQKLTAITPTDVTDAVQRSSSTVFEITAEATERNATAPAAPVIVTPTGGLLHMVESVETELGKWNVTLRDTQEQAVPLAVVMNAVTALQTESQVTEKGAAADTDLTASGGGGMPLIQKQGVVTPGGKKDVTVTTKTPVPVAITLTYNNLTGAETRWYFKNQTQAAVQAYLNTLTQFTYNDVMSWGGLNEFGLLDGHISSRVPVNGGTSTGVWWFLDNLTETHEGEVIDGATHYWDVDTYTYAMAGGGGIVDGGQMYSGGLPGSTWHMEASRGTWNFKRVWQISKARYAYGTTTGGVWTPGPKGAQIGTALVTQAVSHPFATS